MMDLVDGMEERLNEEGLRVVKQMGHWLKSNLLKNRLHKACLKTKTKMKNMEKDLLAIRASGDPRVEGADGWRLRKLVEEFNKELRALLQVRVEDLIQGRG